MRFGTINHQTIAFFKRNIAVLQKTSLIMIHNKSMLAVLGALAILAGSAHGGAVPVAAPLAVASFGSSYTAHSINHALAQPVALPAVAKYAASPLIAAAPYVAAPLAAAPYVAAPLAAAPYVAAPYASAPYVAAPYATAPYVASPYATTPLRYSAAFPSHAAYLAR